MGHASRANAGGVEIVDDRLSHVREAARISRLTRVYLGDEIVPAARRCQYKSKLGGTTLRAKPSRSVWLIAWRSMARRRPIARANRTPQAWHSSGRPSTGTGGRRRL